MNKKLLSLLVAFAAFISGCGINDLENRLDKIENALGTNEPLAVEFTTQDNSNREIAIKTEFLFKAKGYNSYMQINSATEVEVFVERFADVDWNEGAWIFFYYNPETKEITNQSSRVYFYNKFGQWTSPRFDTDYTGHSVNLNLKGIDIAKGFVDVEFTGSTTADSDFNYFDGKAMNGTFRFKGTLDVYDVTNGGGGDR